MTIERQHDDTEIHELVGKTCDALIAVQPADEPSSVLMMYMRVGDRWHRFFLDAGLLIWREGPAPDAEDDLDAEHVYSDVGERAGAAGRVLRSIRMRENRLRIRFDDGSRIDLVEDDDTVRLKLED
ncbi:MAG: hypothetical protein OEU46_21345 [Alphaproteobacteria bacterium]|nr:hypothetical protein [Alphaproteobacteria bacterium]